jgi:hypothetical protein
LGLSVWMTPWARHRTPTVRSSREVPKIVDGAVTGRSS